MWKKQKIEFQNKKEIYIKRDLIEKYKVSKPFLSIILPYIFTLIYICYFLYLYFNWDKIDNYFYTWLIVVIPSIIIYSLNVDWNKEINFKRIIKNELKYEFDYKDDYYYTDDLSNYLSYITSKYLLIFLHILPLFYYLFIIVFSSYISLIITLLLVILLVLFLIYKKM